MTTERESETGVPEAGAPAGLEERLGAIQADVRQLSGKLSEHLGTTGRQAERLQAMTSAKRLAFAGAGLVCVGFVVLVGVLVGLDALHVVNVAVAPVSRAIGVVAFAAGTPLSAASPVASLAWAAAVGFLGYVVGIAAIVAGIVAAIARVADKDY